METVKIVASVKRHQLDDFWDRNVITLLLIIPQCFPNQYTQNVKCGNASLHSVRICWFFSSALCVRLVKYLFFYFKCKCSGIFFYHFALIMVRYLGYSCDATSNIVYSEILPLGILRSGNWLLQILLAVWCDKTSDKWICCSYFFSGNFYFLLLQLH